MTDGLALWPPARSLQRGAGWFRLPELIRVRVTHPAVETTDVLDALQPLHGAPDSEPHLVVAPADVEPGGYALQVAAAGGIRIGCRDREGMLAAVTTLKQLLPNDVWRPTPLREGLRLPEVHLEDAPVHAWRGHMLDVARHFTPVDELLRLVDVLAMHKLNVLHLHLSDDQGWRVESRAFPRLNEVATWRPESPLGSPHAARRKGLPPVGDGTPHGGLYSRSDLRALTSHARRRGVTIVPEVDLPGHAGALLAGIPRLATSVTPARTHADTGLQLMRSTVSPLPGARTVLRELLAEVHELLPGPWLHVGGDEADLTDWRTAPEVQAHLTATGLGDVTALRRDFDRFLVETAEQLGRTPVFWDEAFVAGALPPSAVVMAWRGEGVARRASAAGHPVVLAPVDPLYLDYADRDSVDEPLAIGHGIDAARVATWEPPTGEWLGLHAPLWTEYVPDARTRDYRTFPKLSLVASTAWTGRSVGWPAPGLDAQLARLAAAGIEYRPVAGPHPWQRGGTGSRSMSGGLSVTTVRRLLDEVSHRHELTGEELARLAEGGGQT
jgi:hexosaminidase